MIILEAPASDWILFFGHFHPVIVHLPIGMLVIAIVLYLFSKKTDESTRQKAISPIFFWSFVGATFSCLMGWALSQTGEYDIDALFLHQWLGVATAIISLAMAYMSRYWSDDKTMSKLFKPSLWTTLFLIILTGHFGGNLTHGSDYLTSYLPQPIRGWVGMEPRSEKGETGEIIPKITNIQQTIVYQDLIQPVLKQKCWSCHNSEKQKGKLRMDTPEYLTKGGEDGQIIKAGFPLESEMIKRLLLAESEEHHMPPKGKTPMTEDEIAVLHWWVQNGADFNKKVASFPADAKIKTILVKYTKGTSNEGPYLSPVFKLDISEADEADILKLRGFGLLVDFAAKDQAFLEINAVNTSKIGDKELNEISKVSDQLVSLKIGSTQISDALLSIISELPILIHLDLNHTKITDQGISQLVDLPYLESINLYGTKMTDTGLLNLAKIKTLKRIFVWQSKVTDAGIIQFKKLRPNVQVDNGFKGKWPLEIDTVKLVVEEKKK